MRRHWRLVFFAAGGHNAADSTSEFSGDGGLLFTDQSCLDSVDGQCGSRGIQGGALLGSGVREFRADWNIDDHDLQRHGIDGVDIVFLPRAGVRRRGEQQRVFEYGERDDAGRAGHDAANGADEFDGDGGIDDAD